jgi:hypothetical protein
MNKEFRYSDDEDYDNDEESEMEDDTIDEVVKTPYSEKTKWRGQQINILDPCCGPSAIMERVLTDMYYI